jgi:hypothetical protein
VQAVGYLRLERSVRVAECGADGDGLCYSDGARAEVRRPGGLLGEVGGGGLLDAGVVGVVLGWADWRYPLAVARIRACTVGLGTVDVLEESGDDFPKLLL